MTMNKTLEAEITQLHAQICGGLADPNRIMILYTLAQGPRSVSELCTELELSQPLASRHLKILRDRGMAIAERRGALVIYSLGDRRLIDALDLLRAAMRDTLAKHVEMVEALE